MECRDLRSFISLSTSSKSSRSQSPSSGRQQLDHYSDLPLAFTAALSAAHDIRGYSTSPRGHLKRKRSTALSSTTGGDPDNRDMMNAPRNNFDPHTLVTKSYNLLRLLLVPDHWILASSRKAINLQPVIRTPLLLSTFQDIHERMSLGYYKCHKLQIDSVTNAVRGRIDSLFNHLNPYSTSGKKASSFHLHSTSGPASLSTVIAENDVFTALLDILSSADTFNNDLKSAAVVSEIQKQLMLLEKRIAEGFTDSVGIMAMNIASATSSKLHSSDSSPYDSGAESLVRGLGGMDIPLSSSESTPLSTPLGSPRWSTVKGAPEDVSHRRSCHRCGNM
jgi:hypothetical protein